MDSNKWSQKCAKGYVKVVEILLKYGANINAKEMINKFTPLHRAVEKGNF